MFGERLERQVRNGSLELGSLNEAEERTRRETSSTERNSVW